jgi:hypothetical protein
MLSKITWIGRAGISVFHRDLQYLKTWWKGALIVGCALIVLYIIQSILERKLTKAIHTLFIALSSIGLYYTYMDFRKDFAHRLMGERFHIGVYLFWMGWIIISVFMLTISPKKKIIETNSTEPSAPETP